MLLGIASVEDVGNDHYVCDAMMNIWICTAPDDRMGTPPSPDGCGGFFDLHVHPHALADTTLSTDDSYS